MGFGVGLVVAPMVDAILTDTPVRDAGSGAGLLSTVQQVGLALGIALVGGLTARAGILVASAGFSGAGSLPAGSDGWPDSGSPSPSS
jgi:hypothetical protein